MSAETSFGESAGNQSGLNYQRVLSRVIRHWYVVVLSVVAAYGIAFLTNRYAERVYQVTTSLVILEKENMGGAEFLYSNPLLNHSRNFLNEPYLVRSFPLVGSVVDKLNFDVAFYKEGNIKTTEVYDLPIRVNLLIPNGSFGASLQFRVVDENSFSIAEVKTEKSAPKIFRFNDSVEFHGHHFIIQKKIYRDIKSIINQSFILTFLNPNSITSSYVGRLNIFWAEEGAGILNMTITGSNPQKEIDFMSGLIKAYQDFDLEKKNIAYEHTINFINQQLKEIGDSLRIFEAQLLRYKITNSSYGAAITLSAGGLRSNVGQPSGDMSDDVASRLFGQLQGLESQKAELLIRGNYFNYMEKMIRENKDLDLMVLPSAMGIEDQVLSGLVIKLIDAQLEIKLQLDKGLGENPKVQTGQKEIEEIKGYMLVALDELRIADKFKLQPVNEQIGEIEKQIDLLPTELKEFIAVQRNYSLLQNLYLYLMQKMSEAAISKASNVSDISIVNPPMVGAMISPNVSRTQTMWLMVGFLLPVGMFVLLELLNQKVQSKEDIEKISTIPFIGGVWHDPSRTNLAVSAKPKSVVAEAFRAIRSNLNYFTGNQLKKVFMVTSSVSGEGKTFSSINLATVFAMSGRRTLVIGADMRKPKIYPDFNLQNQRGLSGYLSQLNTFTEIIQPTSIENLDLISAGPVPPNPSELLLSGRVENLLKEAFEIYDYIIIDTPPLAIVTDAFVLAKYADHTIFVVRQNYTQRTFVKNIQEIYASEKIKNISIVLNDISKTGPGYGYGYGYGYGRKKDGDGYYSD